MKYLNKREEFLNNLNNLNISTLNEDVNNSGPFANDIPWNDSLLGRLINSTLRKVNIGIGLNRIKSVSNRLKEAFDDLLIGSSIATLDDQDKEQYQSVIIFTFLYNLEKAVNEMDKNSTTIDEIMKLTINAIDETKKSDIKDKDELLIKLNEWLDFLNSLSKGQKVGDIGVKDNYKFNLNNFKSVLRIIGLYGQMKSKRADKVIPHLANKKSFRRGTLTDTEKADRLQKDLNPTTKSDRNNVNSNSDEYTLTESTVSINGALESLYTYVTGQVEAKELTNFLKYTPEQQSGSKFKSSINKIYSYIRKKVGINESLDRLLTMPEKLGDKIITLYQISKTRANGDFDTISDSLKDEIAIFNSTMKAVLYPDLQIGKRNEEVFSYGDFIKEADESVVTKLKDNTLSEKIQDWWSKKMDLNKWLMDKTEVEKVRTNLDKKLEQNKDSIVINGIDPIIEIVKIFNRAYKLHTTQVIPTGRSGGKVSNKTFREYTSFGNGTPENAGSSGGPYRNNKIFNYWEDTVLDIKKETKYQKIFRGETTLKTEDGKIIKNAGKNLLKFMSDMIEGDELYKTRPGSEKGVQAKFLEKYFGYTEKDGKLTFTDSEGDEIAEVANNIKTTELVFSKSYIPFKENKELENTFFASNITKDGVDRQIYFYIQQIDNTYLYMTYCSSFFFIKNYITRTGVSIRGDIKGDLPLGILMEKTNDGKEYIIKGVRVKISDFIQSDGKFILNDNFNVKYITKFDSRVNNPSTKASLSTKEDEVNFNQFYTLCQKVKYESGKEGLKRFKIRKNTTDIIREVGGFPNIKESNDISKTSITKS